MEEPETETKEEAQKLKIVIRCAKAAILLSSLASIADRRQRSTSDGADEMLMRAMSDLKIELARERMRSRRVRLCGLMEVLLLIVVLLSLWTFCLMLVLEFH
ncbi:uncharacterized protein LOC131162534 [Malania oleifera]|uniref:uncharacterized protein LOC131162534 n=1 Tax=Malania oleifera TaxID=397392 RepID=UPI0025AE61B1|nr:uncharacterized protein LOC131162534 [Malania oleifera]